MSPGARMPASPRRLVWRTSWRRPASLTSRRLQARASVDPAWFWAAAVDDLTLDWQRAPRTTLDISAGIEWATWWGGGAFNHAAASVDRRARLDPDGSAIVWEGEDGEVRALDNLELRRRGGPGGVDAPVARRADRRSGRDPAADARRDRGRRPGPGQAGGHLHADLLGLWRRSRSPRRLADCEASMLITADRSWRRGGMVPLKSTADAAVAMVPSVREVLVVRRVRGSVPIAPTTTAARRCAMDDGRDHWWHEALAAPGLEPFREAPRDRSRDAVHDHLHLWHDRPAQGRAPRPWRLPHQGRPGPRSRLRPSPRRPALLVHGSGLDDGPLGHQRGVAAGRVARPLRGHARLPGPTGCGPSPPATA